MNLKQKLDRIYSDIYKTNEANEENRKVIIAGFEDAVNEGIGKWLGKAVGGIASAPSRIGRSIRTGWDNLSSKTKDLYNKGVEKGKEVVSNVKDWFKRTGESITRSIGEWGDRLRSGWDSFSEWCKKTYYNIGLSLLEFWEATKDKAGDFTSAISKFWSDMCEKLRKAYTNTIETMAKLGKNVSKWTSDNWKKLKEWGEDRYEGSVEWLRQKYNQSIEFLLKAGDGTSGAIKKAISFISAWMVIKPYTWISKQIDRIPALYDSFKKWLETQAKEFKLGFEETAGRPWNRAKGYMIPVTFPDVNLKAIEDDEDEWAKSKEKYDRLDEPFGLGTNNDWSKLGMPKSTSTGKSFVSELLTLVDLIKHDDNGQDAGKDIDEIRLELGEWIADKATSSNAYRKSVPVSDLYTNKLDAKRASDKEATLSSKDFSDKEKMEIGEAFIEVIDEVLQDPRHSLYDEDAKQQDVESVAKSIAESEALQKMKEYSSKDLSKILISKGFSQKAAQITAALVTQKPEPETKEVTLSSGKKVTVNKKASIGIKEREFEGLIYLKTFERFRY